MKGLSKLCTVIGLSLVLTLIVPVSSILTLQNESTTINNDVFVDAATIKLNVTKKH